MKIYNITPNYIQNYALNLKQTSFSGHDPVETITHYNIGIMPDGYIGKVKVFNSAGKEEYLDVLKVKCQSGDENYYIKDKAFNTVGEMTIQIKKFYDYDRTEFPQDPSHIWVQNLENYSSDRSGSEECPKKNYKSIGTRLMQIAQRRSDECGCNGNIKLYSKKDSKEFYEKLGFKVENGGYHQYYLPPEAKEPLSKMYGGL